MFEIGRAMLVFELVPPFRRAIAVERAGLPAPAHRYAPMLEGHGQAACYVGLSETGLLVAAAAYVVVSAVSVHHGTEDL